MSRLALLSAITAATLAGTASASCPDFLNHSMRQLASTDSIQFCEAYEGKALLIVNTAAIVDTRDSLRGWSRCIRHIRTRVSLYWDSRAMISFKRTTTRAMRQRSALKNTTSASLS